VLGTANTRVGLFPASTDRSMPLLELARAAEARGFSSMVFNEHTHIPVEHSRSAFPAGGAIADRYARFWDPFVASSFVGATTALEVGTCVSLVAEHDAIALAKAIATIDTLSGGRFIFGVGWGWLREEVEDHGYAAHRRADVVREKVELMRELWTREEAEYAGEFVRMSRSRAWPKPVQRPTLPVLLGAPPAERNFRRVAEWADGWIPMGNTTLELPELDDQLRVLRREWERAGRSEEDLHLTVIQRPARESTLRASLTRADALGVERVVLLMNDLAVDESLSLLDHAASAFAVSSP
jgi:probable F420-dependent oxidoreductase